jgi:hypothetical protein
MTNLTPFQRLLGDAFDHLPEPVRRLHGLATTAHTAGLAEITAARNPTAWLVCKLAGLPKPGRDVPVSVSFHPNGGGREFWNRHFAGRRYASTMAAGHNHLVEHFGPFDLHFRLRPSEKGLEWSLIGWRLLGLPLPTISVPRIECLEAADGDRFTFDIDVAFPLIGHVIHYKGWLVALAAAGDHMGMGNAGANEG